MSRDNQSSDSNDYIDITRPRQRALRRNYLKSSKCSLNRDEEREWESIHALQNSFTVSMEIDLGPKS